MSCKNCNCSSCNPIKYPATDLNNLIKDAKNGIFSNDKEGLENLQEALSGQGRREYFIWTLIYQEKCVKSFIKSFEDLLLECHPNEQIFITWCDFYDLTIHYLFSEEETRNKILGALFLM